MRAINRYVREEYYKGYKIRRVLFEYGNGSCKVEKWVYGPDGYYRPGLSVDTYSPPQSLVDWIKGEK